MMKRIVIILICLAPFKCFSQLIYGYTPAQVKLLDEKKSVASTDIGIGTLSYQKTAFFIKVNDTDGKIFINDDSGRNIHEQKKGKGYFRLVTGNDPQFVVIYYDLGGKHIPIKRYFGDSTHITLMFGNGNAEVQIETHFLPVKFNETNNRFVRFLLLGKNIDPPNFSLSVNGIPLLSKRTEPIEGQTGNEKHFLVNETSYTQLKDYILNYRYGDAIANPNIQHESLLLIDIDFKHRYFIKADKGIILLKNIRNNVSSIKSNTEILNWLNAMIQSLDDEIQNQGDPN